MAATEPGIPPIDGDDRPANHHGAPRIADPWRWRATILGRAGRLLAAPFEGEPNLQEIARLIVPYLADWCAIDLVDNGGTPRIAALAHINPQQREAPRERWQHYLDAIRFPDGYAGVPRSHKVFALHRLTDRPRHATVANQAFFRALADLRAHSALVVPLVARGSLLGVMTLALVRPGREFAHDDLPVAQQVAHFCALAIDNARLFSDAQAEIDERTAAERAAHASEARYRALVEQAADGIIATDLDGTLIEVNAAAAAMLGYQPAALVGRPAAALLPGEDLASDPPRLAETLAGQIVRHERRLRHRDGSERRIAISAKRIGTDRIQGIWHDVTAQRATETALRESEERFRTIFLQATDAILIFDDAERCLQANPAGCALFGVPDEASIVGRWAGEFAPPEARDRAGDAWRDFLAEGRKSGIVALQRPDGTIRTAEYQATANFQPGRHLAILRDATEREQAAADLADIQRQLTAARETERLRLARELHDTAVQQLLGISFQLAAYPEASGAGSQQTRPTILADIRRAVLDTVDHLRGVIRELRPPGLEEFGLSAALDGYLSAIKRERGAALPAIVIDLDHIGPDLPHDLALCLFRVAQEALQNAIRHAGAHEVIVSLFRDGPDVCLHISDNGHGFRVPERLSAYTQLGHFGLAGMVERVKLAGGQLTITSSPGEGTSVAARIPLVGEGGEDGRDA
jgi:PAS domain S-box-containing protein